MLRKTIISIVVAAAIIGFFMFLPEPDAPQPGAWPEQPGNDFMLRGVRVFDGHGIRERVDVLVQGGVITVVSPKAPLPRGVPEFAANGHTLLPALVDAHTHNFMSSLSDALRFGVGTQLDMFSAATGLGAAREQRASTARVETADMWSAGTLVTARGGHGTQYGMPIPTLDAPEDADAFIATRIAEGSDFIKIVLESGKGWGMQTPTLDAATLLAAVTAAQRAGKLAVVHVGTQAEAALAVEAGADGLVHIFGESGIEQTLVDAMRERDVFVIPTLAVYESIAGGDHGLRDDVLMRPHLSPSQVESLGSRFPGARESHLVNAIDNVRKLHAAGIRILAGSDAPNPGTAHGASLHRELELLTMAGLSPIEALRAATSGPMTAFGIEGRGRIERDMRADMILVAGDPTTDITDTRAIIAVWKNGHRIQRQRFDGRVESGARLVDPVLARFDDGSDGWIGTTDAIQGGSSGVELVSGHGRLVIEAEVVQGAPWPWAGAMRMLGAEPMSPVDLGDYGTLTLDLRGTGSVHVLFFSGPNAQGIPQMWPVELAGEAVRLDIPLAAVPGLEVTRVRAIAVVAGPEPGRYRLELGEVVLR